MPASTPGRGLWAYFKWPLAVDAVWLAAPPFVLSMAALLAPIRPFDYFWSLVQGRTMVQLGRIPSENLFLYTLPADASFFDQAWLGQLAMYGAYLLGGHSANLLLLAALLSLAMLIALDTGLRLGGQPRFVTIVALLVTPLLVLGAGARTQMFAYPCFAFVLRGAVLRVPGRGLRAILPCALVTVLWANLHGSFVLAPEIFALAGAGTLFARARDGNGRRARVIQALGELLVIVLATLVNPRGPMIYGYAAGIGAAMRVAGGTDVDEWLPLSPLTLPGAAFYALMLGGMVVFVVRRRRECATTFLPHLAFALHAMQSQRFVSWWAISAVVAMASLGGVAAPAERRPGPSWPNVVLLALFVLVTLASLPGAPLFERVAPRSHLPYPEGRALGRETPLRLAESLARGYPGKLFHVQAVGGLVEWTLARDKPRPVAFVDQRFELTPPELWRDYFTICAAGPGWQGLLARYGIGTLLLDETNAPGLLAQLAHHPEWRLVGRELGYHLYERASARGR